MPYLLSAAGLRRCVWHAGACAARAGVRSLCFLDHLLSCGTGRGRVSFYDLRASAWLDLDPDPDPDAQPRGGARRACGFQQLGPGWLCQTDPVYLCAPAQVIWEYKAELCEKLHMLCLASLLMCGGGTGNLG